MMTRLEELSDDKLYELLEACKTEAKSRRIKYLIEDFEISWKQLEDNGCKIYFLGEPLNFHDIEID